MKYVSLILRTSLAFAFFYPALSAIFNPFAWIGYFPEFFHSIIPNDLLLLHLFGITEVIIGFWLLSGKNIFYSSTLSAVLLLFIVLFNISELNILFRDISILGIAVTLAFMHKPEKIGL